MQRINLQKVVKAYITHPLKSFHQLTTFIPLIWTIPSFTTRVTLSGVSLRSSFQDPLAFVPSATVHLLSLSRISNWILRPKFLPSW